MRWLSTTLLIGTALLVGACMAPAPSSSGPTSTPTKPASSKVSPQLIAAFERRYGSPSEAACRNVDPNRGSPGDWIVIDATAKRDAARLIEQLTAVGLRHGAVAAPVVSGYLPICAIPQLETCCSELNFVRESVVETQRP